MLTINFLFIVRKSDNYNVNTIQEFININVINIAFVGTVCLIAICRSVLGWTGWENW